MGDAKYVLAIDLGTSGSKTALVSVFGEVVDFEFQEVPLTLLPGGGAEQDPNHWWDAIINTSKTLLGKGLVPAEDVVGVCCSSQWSGTVAVDQEGRPLMNAMIWMDSRGAPYVAELCKGVIKIADYPPLKLKKWIGVTGGAPQHSGKDPVGHMLFIKNERPEVYRKTYKFLEPKEYLNLRLTGLFATSYDSVTLNWATDNRDLKNVTYSDELLGWYGIEKEKMPELKQSIDVLGPLKKEVAAELGLSEDVKVVMGSPDIQSAAIGSGAVDDFQAHAYIGTSSWISTHVPKRKIDIFHAIATFPCSIPERYFILTEQDTAGKCLTWLRDNILYHQDALLQEECVPDIYKVLDRVAANSPAGANKLIFTPWLNGEVTPVDDHLIRGGFHNLSLSHNREDLVRAIFEGVAFNLRWVLFYLEKLVGRKLDPINMVGGGGASDIWCQIHADIFNRTIRQVKDPIQANARGAAFIASVGLGYITFEDIPKYIKYSKTFTPNPDNRSLYDELYREFTTIYEKNKKICARLNR